MPSCCQESKIAERYLPAYELIEPDDFMTKLYLDYYQAPDRIDSNGRFLSKDEEKHNRK